MLRQADAIILKREARTAHFLHLKYLYLKNEAIDNLLYFKYFVFDLTPFALNLDGNFCDESYKYVLDVVRLAGKFGAKQRQAVLDEEDPLRRTGGLEVEQMH